MIKRITYTWIPLVLFLITYVPFKGHYDTEAPYNRIALFLIYIYPLFVFIFFLIFKPNLKKQEIIIDNCIFIPLLFFPSLIMLSTFMNTEYFTGMFYTNVLLPIAVFATIVLLLNYTPYEKHDVFEVFIYSVLGYTVFSVIIALFLHYGYNFIPFITWENTHMDDLRLIGWYGNPNRMASTIGVSLVICISLYLFFNIKHKKILFTAIILLFVASLLSGSRGVILAYLIVIIINIALKYLKTKEIKVSSLIVLFFVIVLSVGILSWDGSILDAFLKYQTRNDPFIRFRIWSYALDILKESNLYSLLFGSGYLTFITEAGVSSHNGYIRWVVEYGVIFLTLFIVFNLVIIYRSYKSFFKNGDTITLTLINIVVFFLLRDLTTQAIFAIRVEFILYLFSMFLLLVNKVRDDFYESSLKLK